MAALFTSPKIIFHRGADVRQHTRTANHNHYYRRIAVMTDTHSIAQPFEAEVSPANNRQLTVSYASRYPDYSRIPAITLKGQWLEAAGFATGTAVDVKVMEGCIVLTAQPPTAEESELMQSLRQVCKLSARKQKQVQDFIGVITGKQKVA
eukprot:gene13916-16925_t